ncbi:MAG: InlB B-repeat-containing protein [Clostridiales bacterium]|nr:InlB B-repeat-containing protein [Clostridiales bacterium]
MTERTIRNKKRFLIVAVIAFVIIAACALVACSNTKRGADDPVTHIVSFNTNGGSPVNKQIVYHGDKITKPVDPIKGGMTFDGWAKNTSLSSLWNFDKDIVTSDVMLHARWLTPSGGIEPSITEYTVVFVTNCAAVIDSQTVAVGGKVTEPPAITNGDKVFDGWYKNIGCTEPWDFKVDIVYGPTTLYAAWKDGQSQVSTYTVTFDSKGGSAVDSEIVRSGGRVTQPAAPVYGDKIFGGWYKDPDCTMPWNFATDTVTGPTTLYAKWTDNAVVNPVDPTKPTATVTFNVGLAARKEGVYNPPAQTVNAGSRISMPPVTRPNYTLSGWKVENGNTKWNFATDTLSTDTTLFAEWTAGGGGGNDSVAYTPSSKMQNANTFYLHYKRSDNNYTGWHVWAWNGSQINDNWYEIDSSLTDTSGAIVPIPLKSGATSISFLVVNGDWNNGSVKDGSADNVIALSSTLKVGDSYHWFVQSGYVAEGTNYLQSEKKGSALQTTEAPRASITNVNRSYAANLAPEATATTCDDMGVGYQIFVASFCDSNGDGMGDIRGIINKLDYLDSLNVDVLWLTPVQSSDSSHGYDCYDYYAIDTKFGTNADYRELVYKAHQKGMKIIMDLVVNHTSQRNEWFIKSKQGVIETVTYQDGTTEAVNYRDFYRWKNSGGSRWYGSGDGWYFYSSFNSSMPELNYDYQPARNMMADVATYWMKYGLDGFRMDAIKHMFMWDESTNESGDVHGGVGDNGYDYNLTKDVEWFKEFNHKLKAKYPNCFLLGEQLSGDETAVSPFYAGMDSLFDFNVYYNLPNFIKNGNAATQASNSTRNANLYKQYRKDRPINSMITSNHDIPRLYNQIGNGDVAKTKLYFAVIMTMPGLSWIYYGDEIGLVGGTGSDQYQRQSMKWTESWANKCSNNGVKDYGINNSTKSVQAQEADNNSLLGYVKALTKLRNDYPMLISGDATYSTENGMLKITVTKSNETIVVYHNFSSSQKTITLSGTVLFGSKTLAQYDTFAIKL